MSSSATVSQNEVLIRRWIEELWNQKRPEIIDELLTDETLAHGMGPNGTDLRGTAPFRSSFDVFVAAFPDLHITIARMVAADDMVACYLTCRATHRGDSLGVAPTGNAVTFPCMTMARICDGKIVEGWNLIDFFSMFQQIGAATVPPRAAENLP